MATYVQCVPVQLYRYANCACIIHVCICITTKALKLGSQYDNRLPFHLFRIVPFGRLMFELFTNYRSLVPFPSLQFTLC